MARVNLGEKSYHCQSEESVLDLLLRENVAVPYGCRQGACQSCMLKSNDKVPAEAQQGLKENMKQQNYFLACQCYPQQDMTVSFPQDAGFFTEARVLRKEVLNADIVHLLLECERLPEFRAGQFVNLQKPDGLRRSYSIANIPNEDNILEFHIRRLPGGRFSEWAYNELSPGDKIPVSEPLGLCFYNADKDRLDQGLLLVGTGSGLAPLVGIVNEALNHGHTGPIHLYHGSHDADSLYWVEKMRRLADQRENFRYTPCISGSDVPGGYARGRANEVALEEMTDLKGWRVYLCGHPGMVNDMKRQAFLQGVSMSDIHADPFVLDEAG